MTVSIIVARSSSGVIGINNQLPWHLPADLKHFKSMTTGHPIIMGRKTWESLGRPLPNRRNMVISRQRQLALEGAEVFGSIEEALKACSSHPEVFIIGGAQIYAQAMPLADQLIITEVAIEVVGDAFFPAIDASWQVVKREEYPAQINPQNPLETFPAYAFVTYQRQ